MRSLIMRSELDYHEYITFNNFLDEAGTTFDKLSSDALTMVNDFLESRGISRETSLGLLIGYDLQEMEVWGTATIRTRDTTEESLAGGTVTFMHEFVSRNARKLRERSVTPDGYEITNAGLAACTQMGRIILCVGGLRPELNQVVLCAIFQLIIPADSKRGQLEWARELADATIDPELTYAFLDSLFSDY